MTHESVTESASESVRHSASKWSKKKIVTVAIIAGSLLAVMGWHQESCGHQTVARAKVDIELLSVALEKYKMDYGEYPGVEEDSPIHGDITEQLYTALFYDGWNYKTNGVGDETEIYLNELDPRRGTSRMVKLTDAKVPPANLKIQDPWGRPYRYRKGDDAQNPDFDLWSAGKDGLTQPEDPEKNLRENRDDIRNF